MKIRYRVQNGQGSNIEPATKDGSLNGLQEKPKIQDLKYIESPLEQAKQVDSNTAVDYHEMDRLAENWIDLLFNGILENHNDRYNKTTK